MSEHPSSQSLLPHHRLRAFRVAVELLELVRAARISDRVLRDQALKAAKSACANVAEGAGRVLKGDKARAYGIARAEALEAFALTEVAMRAGEARRELRGALLDKGNQLYALLCASFAEQQRAAVNGKARRTFAAGRARGRRGASSPRGLRARPACRMTSRCRWETGSRMQNGVPLPMGDRLRDVK